ncbi:MAG: DeoR family transcriptional regulator [Caldithrix sp.]|nr:DeoR family transcriptional regulator [Caldithrix sp.]
MANKESQNIEYKKAWRADCLKVVSAFANSDGGKVLIGVDNNGNPVSLKNMEKLLEDIPNSIRHKLGIIPFVELTDDKTISISIQSSSVPVSYNGKFYIRSGSTLQELQGRELADFLSAKTGHSWDEVIEEQINIQAFDKNVIEKFKKYAVDRIPSISEETEIKTILDKLNLTEKNRFKRAAALLFGNNPQKFYRQSVIRIGKFLSETEIQTMDVVQGSLFSQLENALEILRTKYLVSNIKYEGIHRRDILEYPYEALREAVINALIHRDYSGTSQIQIRVYPDNLKIMNEGKLPPEVPVEKLKTSHLSVPRNTLLAEVFYYAGFIESWGHGTIKIVNKCLQQGLPEPDFREENGVMTVIFYKDKWNENNLKKIGLNERQMKAVMYVKEKGKITNTEYQNYLNTSKRTATNDLEALVKKGLLEKIGTHGRGTYYQIERAIKGQKGQ